MSALTLLHPWYRTYQLAFGLGARLLPWRRPEAVTGAGSFRRLPDGGAAEDAFPVARALLPAETDEGVRLRYSMLEYTVCG